MTRARHVVDEVLFWAGVLGTATGTVAILAGLLANDPVAVAAAIALTALAWAVAASSLDDIRSAAASGPTAAGPGAGSQGPASVPQSPTGAGPATPGGAR